MEYNMSQEINITLKTLDNKRFDVTVNTQDTIESKIDFFKNTVGYTESNIKMIYAGRVLERSKLFSEYGLKNSDVIIIMKSRDPSQTSQQPVPTVTPATPVVPLSAPTVVEVPPPVVPITQSRPARISTRVPTPPPPSALRTGSTRGPILRRVAFPIAERTPIRRASGVSGLPHPSQPQQPPQPPRIITTQQYWAQPAPLEEISPRFSVEQVHAMIPLMMSYITENPQLCTLLLRSQESFRSVITGPGFRGIVRQMLEQSPLIVNALRTGMQATMTINTTSNAGVSAPIPNNADSDDGSNSSQGDDESADNGETGNMIPVLAEMLASINGTSEQSTDTNQPSENIASDNTENSQESNVVSEPNEQEDVAQLVSLTGVPIQFAKQVYDSCGKNVGVAAALLFQVLEGEN